MLRAETQRTTVRCKRRDSSGSGNLVRWPTSKQTDAITLYGHKVWIARLSDCRDGVFVHLKVRALALLHARGWSRRRNTTLEPRKPPCIAPCIESRHIIWLRLYRLLHSAATAQIALPT